MEIFGHVYKYRVSRFFSILIPGFVPGNVPAKPGLIRIVGQIVPM